MSALDQRVARLGGTLTDSASDATVSLTLDLPYLPELHVLSVHERVTRFRDEPLIHGQSAETEVLELVRRYEQHVLDAVGTADV